MENLVIQINEEVLNDAIAEIRREDRNSLRTDKKRAWSPRRTRAPFYFRARGKSHINSFKAAIELTQKVMDQLGAPWELSNRGRPASFSPKKLASAVLVKHFQPLSFEALREKLDELDFDCREAGKKKSTEKIPSKSMLHRAMQRIPKEYLEEALRLLDDWAIIRHERVFGHDGEDQFGVDGTENTCIELEEALIALKRRLRRTTDKVNAISRLVTNTICEISSSKRENARDLRKLLKMREKSGRTLHTMEVFGDRDYDVEYNYEYAVKNGVELVIKPKMIHGKPYKGRFRKKVQAHFSARRYKTRKLTERPFGNTYLRDKNRLYYKRPDMKQKGEILRFIAHNMKAYFMQGGWEKVFKNLHGKANCEEVGDGKK